MKNFVITIARGYGSGGRTIGRMLAKELDIPYYDRELLRLASDQSGINEALFANADEKIKGTLLFKKARAAYMGELIPPDSEDFVSNDNLFNFQAKVIRDLAATESCVIVGRCADFVPMPGRRDSCCAMRAMGSIWADMIKTTRPCPRLRRFWPFRFRGFLRLF